VGRGAEGSNGSPGPTCRSADLNEFAIIDPALAIPGAGYLAGVVTHQAGKGDLGCAGHAWTQDGDLFIGGGNEEHGLNCNLVGSKLAYLFVPTEPFGQAMWKAQGDLDRRLWYPTIVMIAEAPVGGIGPTTRFRMLILGGDINDDDPRGPFPPFPRANTYQVFVPPPDNQSYQGTYQTNTTYGRLFVGPVAVDPLTEVLTPYARAYLVSDGNVVVTGMRRQTVFLRHQQTPAIQPTAWTNLGDSGSYITWHSLVGFPNIDAAHSNVLMKLGGSALPTQGVGEKRWVQFSKPTRYPNAACFYAGGYGWTDNPDYPVGCSPALPQMLKPRHFATAIVMPDASILVLGGFSASSLAMERYAGGVWTELAPLVEHRNQHSTAVLLPSGKVLIGGSENHGVCDFELYVPWYLACGAPRPVIDSVKGVSVSNPNYIAPVVTVDESFKITYTVPPGVAVQKVVLTRPMSMTHSTDTDQRYVELEIDPEQGGPGEIWAKTPAHWPGFTTSPDEVAAPPGYYMVWLVTSTGIPSVAQWIQLKP
jgi:hypothetical protein